MHEGKEREKLLGFTSYAVYTLAPFVLISGPYNPETV